MNVIIDVAIGLVLVFIVTAVVVSSITEVISWVCHLRASKLEEGVARLVGENPEKLKEWFDGLKGLTGLKRLKGSKPGDFQTATLSQAAPVASAIYKHPLIAATVTPKRWRVWRPSYIDAKNFAAALLATFPRLTSYDLLEALITPRLAEIKKSAVIPGLPASMDAYGVAATIFDGITPPLDPRAVLTTCLGSPDNVKSAVAAAGADTEVGRALATLAGDVGNDPGRVANRLLELHGTVPSDADLAGIGLAAIAAIPNPALRNALLALQTRAAGDAVKFRHEVEDWFDREMARVSGWYGKLAQAIMIFTGLVVAIVLNLSAFTIGRALWADPGLRVKVADAAAASVTTTTTTAPATTTTTAPATNSSATAPTTSSTAPATTTTTTKPFPTYDDLKGYGMPVGWGNKLSWPSDAWDRILHVLGWIGVAIAASFGAPFWFDALNKLVNLRTAGPKPPTAAKDRDQQSPPTA
jgi:hypothetical protein